MFLPLSLDQVFVKILKRYVSPVIEYLPVSPVAPPNKITLVLLTKVIVCPNLACGISPYTSSSSTDYEAPEAPGVFIY